VKSSATRVQRRDAQPLRQRLHNQYYYLRERLRGLPLPPTEMMYLVGGMRHAWWYVQGGSRAAQSVSETMQKSRIPMEQMKTVLDFGCGSGRVLRHWHNLARAGVRFYGTDYNPELVAWCRRTVPFATIGQNDLEPPLSYPDNAFDLIYALSTFTHWTVELQKAWMREFTRILKPGGCVLFTTHGDYYLPELPLEDQRRFLDGKPVVVNAEVDGSNACGAFHPHRYVRDELLETLNMLHWYPRSALGNPWQDIYLAQKPTDFSARVLINSGWQEREQPGASRRWSDPVARMTINYLSADSRFLRMKSAGVVRDTQLELMIGDRILEPITITKEWQTHYITLPEGLPIGAHHCTLRVREPFVPADVIAGSDDQRSLGILVDAIDLV
jgi:SAM-dependent methyltransferase